MATNSNCSNSGNQHRVIRRKGSSGAVPPAELSSAMSFLGETALSQACDLLSRQSEELFDSGTDPTAVDGERISNHTQEVPGSKPKQINQQTAYVDKFSQLYQKCKSAYDIIVRGDELGILSDAGVKSGSGAGGGHPGLPSPAIRRTHTSSLGVTSSMPPPPSHFTRVSGSSTPSLHRSRSGLSGGTRRVGVGGGAARKIHRSTSNVSDTSVESKGEPPPPPEVLQFLKQLNSNSSQAGDQRKLSTAPGLSSTVSINTPKKRKGNSQMLPPPPRLPADKKTSASLNEDASLTNSDKIPPQTTIRTLQSTSAITDTTTQTSKKNEQNSTGSRRSSSSSLGNNEKAMYDIGESVFVKIGDKNYGAIVTNVDYGSDEDRAEKGRVMYEVEFSDGEETKVDPKNMFRNEDD